MKEVANEEIFSGELKLCYRRSVCMKIFIILANLEDHKSKQISCLLKFYERCRPMSKYFQLKKKKKKQQ